MHKRTHCSREEKGNMMSVPKRLKVLLVVLTVILAGMANGLALAEEMRPLKTILSDVGNILRN